MKKKSMITMLAALALVGVIGVGSTLAYFTDNDSASNTVTMGKVDIELAGSELATEKFVPGDVLAINPVITVDAGSEDCYLRVKVEVNDIESAKTLSDDYKAYLVDCIMNDDWTLGEGGYYYHSSVHEANAEVKLSETVTIPTTWGNEVADAGFEISITAEAIQAENFTPQETDGVINGWNGVTAETYPLVSNN